MSRRPTLAIGIAVVTAIGATLVVVERGGAIAWTTLVVAGLLLAKFWRRPAQRDLLLALALSVVAVGGWLGTRQYVINTWESGEVVELAIDLGDRVHKARLWVLDVESDPIVYYDAAPEVAQALLAGEPLGFTRAGAVSRRIPNATRVSDVPESTAAELLNAMNEKYGERNSAATLYYVLLGRPRDRIDVIVRLVEA